jgi:hypothetical protein
VSSTLLATTIDNRRSEFDSQITTQGNQNTLQALPNFCKVQF